jgi:N-acetylneuraminic acid mutarotase
MPIAVTSNAVASLRSGIDVYSFMGVGAKKTWDDITNKTYVLSLKSGKWVEGRPVPGVAGRLGASAIGVKGLIYLFGGYTVDGQGNEFILGDVNTYATEERRWLRAADIPVPVDDAVIGATHDRYVYLVGGRSKSGPVNNVQIYDTEKNLWSQATPFPGAPVFGHAGAVADDAIVYVDGAKKDPAGGKRYVASDECWIGKIDKKDPNKIAWSKLPAHPGPGRFGIVAGAGEREPPRPVLRRHDRSPQLQRRRRRRETGRTFAIHICPGCARRKMGNRQRGNLRRSRRRPRHPVHSHWPPDSRRHAEQRRHFGARAGGAEKID